MTVTLHAKAVVGRRVEFAYHRDQDTYLPGIITAITEDPASLRVRLDGARSTVACRADYDGIRYLDQVVPVPDLPMGRFTPSAADFGGLRYADVAVCELSDDTTVFLTADSASAEDAAIAYGKSLGMAPDYVYADLALERMKPRWAVFEWQPGGAECSWQMRFADEGEDMAVRIHYLPA